jgi:hypothetical protein
MISNFEISLNPPCQHPDPKSFFFELTIARGMKNQKEVSGGLDGWGCGGMNIVMKTGPN